MRPQAWVSREGCEGYTATEAKDRYHGGLYSGLLLHGNVGGVIILNLTSLDQVTATLLALCEVYSSKFTRKW